MIVCNCNRLNERNIATAIRAGAANWRDVYRYHGCAVQCGACVNEVCERLAASDRRAIPELALPALAKA